MEHWDELDDSEKEAMETLKFIEKAHDLLHQHDHLGLGHDGDHEHDDDSPDGDAVDQSEAGNDLPDENEENSEVAKIEIEGGEEGGFLAIAADPNGAQEAFKNDPGADDPNGEGPALGFDLEALAGSGTVTDELRRIYNYMSQVNHQYRCPQEKSTLVPSTLTRPSKLDRPSLGSASFMGVDFEKGSNKIHWYRQEIFHGFFISDMFRARKILETNN